jgi:hypothetical protein
MKRRARQIITLTLLAVATAFLVSWPSVIRFGVQEGLQGVRRKGTNLSWSGLTAGFSSVALDSLTVWFSGPRVQGSFAIPVSIELRQISIAVRVASLLFLSPSVTYSTRLYGGSISGEAQQGMQGTHLSGNLENIELGKHPQLSSLGVRGGSTNGTFQDLRVTRQGIEDGAFSVRVRELEIPSIKAATTLLRTQNFGTVDLDAEGDISPSMVDVRNIRLASLFGSVVGNLTCSEHLSRAPSLKGSFEVSLSEQGVTTLGPWLPLIPGAGLDPSTSSFAVAVATTPCSNSRGDSTVVRLQSGCLKLAITKL